MKKLPYYKLNAATLAFSFQLHCNYYSHLFQQKLMPALQDNDVTVS